MPWNAAFTKLTPPTRLALFALACVLGGCDSEADKVCGDIANCSHGGSDDWVTACRDQAKSLGQEADQSGCSAPYDDYFTCADDHFACHGNQSSFPSCDAREQTLAVCLDAARAHNACGELDAKLAACPPAAASSANDGASVFQPCTTGGVCSARCYLDSIADVCAPTPFELDAFADCASHCVP